MERKAGEVGLCLMIKKNGISYLGKLYDNGSAWSPEFTLKNILVIPKQGSCCLFEDGILMKDRMPKFYEEHKDGISGHIITLKKPRHSKEFEYIEVIEAGKY